MLFTILFNSTSFDLMFFISSSILLKLLWMFYDLPLPPDFSFDLESSLIVYILAGVSFCYFDYNSFSFILFYFRSFSFYYFYSWVLTIVCFWTCKSKIYKGVDDYFIFYYGFILDLNLSKKASLFVILESPKIILIIFSSYSSLILVFILSFDDFKYLLIGLIGTFYTSINTLVICFIIG